MEKQLTRSNALHSCEESDLWCFYLAPWGKEGKSSKDNIPFPKVVIYAINY